MGYVVKYDFKMRPGKHCYKCEDRVVGCHSTCEKYIQACKEWEEYKASIDKKIKDDADYEDYKARRCMETKKFVNSHKKGR